MGMTEAMIFGFGVLSGLVINLNGWPLASLALATASILVFLKLSGLAP
jgi:hypothetical protein